MSANEIPLTQGYITIVDQTDFDLVSRHKWYAQVTRKYVYAANRGAASNGKQKIIYLHRLICRPETGLFVDHIDGDTLNNRRDNLRIVTRGQNNQNSVSRSGSSSQYKGVTWNKKMRSWQAGIKMNGKSKHLGRFECERLAAIAYDNAAREFFGSYALLNFPQSRHPARQAAFCSAT